MRIITCAAVLLFALSTFNVGWPHFIWSWKLNVLVNQYGHYAILLCLALLLPCLTRPGRKTIERGVTIFLLLVSVAIFAQAIFGALKVEPYLKSQFRGEFGSQLKVSENWFSFSDLFFAGFARKKVPFGKLVFAQRESGALTLDFYSPVETAAKPAAWVMVVHGGGWDSGNSEQLPELNWELARLGYAVVSINYRLSPDAKWPAALEDATEALHYVEKNAEKLGVDPKRWAVLGRSAGGQIAGVLAYGQKENPPRGAILYYSPTEMVFGYEVGEEDDILASRSLMRKYMGPEPYKNIELYKSASPLELISSQSCPTLLMHGKSDSLVWFKHSERLYRRLKALDRKAIFTAFESGPHGFDFNLAGPEGQISMSATREFLAQVLN